MTGILLTHATIYTLDHRQPTANALAVDDGRILAVGEIAPLLAEFGSRFAVEDLHGWVILPGLTDAHLHLQHYALGLALVDCETPTRAECLQRIAARARQTPPGEWVRGQGFNHNAWVEGLGDTANLDAAAPHNPVYITHKSLHSAWANHLALERAGLTSETPDPPGAHLGRKPDGSLDGILYEENAMCLITNVIPQPTFAQITQALRQALPDLHQMGLTGVHDFDRRDCFAALQVLHASGDLKLRVLKSLPLDELPQAVALGLRQGFGDDMLRIGPVKAFMDGALGPQTAAMLAPYEGKTDCGILMMDADEIFAHAGLAAENGLSMAVHAIGDRAVRAILDTYARLRDYEREHLGSPDLRHRIEHVQLTHPADAGRLSELDVIASMQPLHATSDMRMADRYWGKRAELSYALRTQLDAGARLALGSDAPVESPNPFLGLHAAVTRRRADGSPGAHGWYPEQRLTVLEALHGYTTGPAYAAGMEDRLGRLAPGFLADLIVLDTDPFHCKSDQLQYIKPLRTMVGGEWVYKR